MTRTRENFRRKRGLQQGRLSDKPRDECPKARHVEFARKWGRRRQKEQREIHAHDARNARGAICAGLLAQSGRFNARGGGERRAVGIFGRHRCGDRPPACSLTQFRPEYGAKAFECVHRVQRQLSERPRGSFLGCDLSLRLQKNRLG